MAASAAAASAAAASAARLAAVQGALVAALLRWRAGQWDLAQVRGQAARGARYVGPFTGRLFAALDSAQGVDPELALQLDCAAAHP